MRVMKFGGSSLATPERVRTVGALIREAAERERVVVVTSAVAGTTDFLVGLVSRTPGDGAVDVAAEGRDGLPVDGPTVPDPLEELRRRHEGLWRAVAPGSKPGEPIPPLDELFHEMVRVREEAARSGGWSPPAGDLVLGMGERLSSRLLVAHLEETGLSAIAVDGADVMRTDSTFGEARVDLEETFRLLGGLLRSLPAGSIPVITGFIGSDPDGRRTTLGRGSSDYSAAVVGAALGARIVEIWTDVDGVHGEDPAQVPGAPLLARLSYGEARAMARAGAKVLHPEALDPLEPLGIPLRVRNTLRPGSQGTLVGPGPRGARRIHLYLAGATGQVGRALLRQLASLGPALREADGVEVLVAGTFCSRGQLWSREGIPAEEVLSSLGNESPPDWREIPGRMASAGHSAPVFVDCTACPEVAGAYLEILEAGVPLITPNKLAVSGPLSTFLRVRDAARRSGVPFRYETTVGAALPVLGTLRDLLRGGDRVRTITGVLSGTLSFVFARLRDGVPFSVAVREARQMGLTEPHPREDLTGGDVARKLLILLRESGRSPELSDITVESLVPSELSRETDPEAFLAGLEVGDAVWASRVEEARSRSESLAYVGCFDGTRPWVGVRSFPSSHSLHHLLPAENRVVLGTERYGGVPLTIAGPGAGPEITASGVLADLLAAVRERHGVVAERVVGNGPSGSPSPWTPGRRVA